MTIEKPGKTPGESLPDAGMEGGRDRQETPKNSRASCRTAYRTDSGSTGWKHPVHHPHGATRGSRRRASEAKLSARDPVSRCPRPAVHPTAQEAAFVADLDGLSNTPWSPDVLALGWRTSSGPDEAIGGFKPQVIVILSPAQTGKTVKPILVYTPGLP